MALTDRDMLVVKNLIYDHQPFRSSFAVTSGVYYYEVTPLIHGEMTFGWATREAELTWTKKIGDDQHSIGLELGPNCRIYYDGEFSNTNLSPLESSNVIGCLIDTSNRYFQFNINGQQVKSPDNLHFSTWPYYATVGLGKEVICELNFGQAPFKFPPKDIQFNDFYKANGNAEKYLLTETVAYNKHFWFAHPVIANQVTLFYCDPKQIKCDELVRQLEYPEHNQTSRLDHSIECGRLVQSVIEVVGRRLTCDQKDLVGRWVRQVNYNYRTKNASCFEEAKFSELLYPYFHLPVTSANSTKFHNICLIVIMLYFNDSFLIENLDIFLSKTIQTFLSLSTFTTDPLKLVYALTFLEHHSLPLTTKALLSDSSIMSTLWWCSELFGHVSSVSRLYEPSCDLVRLQAGMCARWFRELVMQDEKQHFSSQSTLDPGYKSRYIKLSSDCLSARNYGYGWESIRSVYSVSSGIFYYEAVLLTDGNMRFGWATEQTNWYKIIGGDIYSIGFEASDGHAVYHQWKTSRNISNITTKARWSVGDVVGCLIDCQKNLFKFYLNGKLVKYKDKDGDERIVNFSADCSDQPYRAAVSLHLHQQCYLNLGQCPFRHPPSVPFHTFHVLPAPPPPPLYSPRLTECYSLVQVLVNDQVELVFDDDKQKESDRLAKTIQKNITSNESVSLKLKTQLDRLRLLQSLISVSEPMLLDSCLSVYANWIAHLIKHSTSQNPEFPDLVARLLYPYFTLHLTNDTISKHRCVCAVLASIIALMNNIKDRVNLYQQFLSYLTQIVVKYNQINDEWMFLFALVGIGNMELSQNEIATLKSNATFCQIIEIKQNLDLNDPHIFSINPNLPLLRQSVFISQWFCRNILNLSPPIDPSSLNPSTSNLQTLNSAQSSSHLKLSTDLISARSDHSSIDRPFESVRSMSCVDSKRYYYEVTLATSGPMRFGWTSENTDLTRINLGDDEYSIGFDGYNRCVWHRGRSYPIRNVVRWNARDVVGCMILAIEKTFHFYLNGDQISFYSFFDKPHYSSVHPYYAAASLSTFQQCRFAFDQVKYPTKRPSFLLMNSLRKVNSSVSQNLFNFPNSNIRLNNSVFNIGSTVSGNYTMKQITQGSESNSTRTTKSNSKKESPTGENKSSFDERDEDKLKE